jgi:hypothetical protein
MARRGPAHHKSRKQVRGVQAAVRPPVRVGKHYPAMVQRLVEISQPATLLVPIPDEAPTIGPTDEGQAAWVFVGWFLNLTRSTKHEQRVLVYCSRADLWSAGDAMAKKGVTKYFTQRLHGQRPPGHLHDHTLLGVSCEGRYDPVTRMVHPQDADGFR